MNKRSPESILLVANWDSNVGYAWWLMESFWAAIAYRFDKTHNTLLSYPSISILPKIITNSPITPVEKSIGLNVGVLTLITEYRFLRLHRVAFIYFSDRPTCSFKYLIYRLAGVKLIIVHDHTPGLRKKPNSLKRIFKTIIRKLPWINVDGCIGASNFVRQRLIEVDCIPPNRCWAAPNGITTEPPSPVQTKELVAPLLLGEGPVIVMVARANPFKNIEFALHCVKALMDKKKIFHFLLCGDGPSLINLKEIAAQLGISHYVTFAGKRSDIDRILQHSDIAFHPSKGEVGYSLAILEYMRASLPVVVPDNPSVSEATIDQVTGRIYKENDLQSACTALAELIDNQSQRKRMGVEARKLVLENYSLPQTHAALLHAIERLGAEKLKHGTPQR